MNFTCTDCNDTGSRDKLGTYLDCNACGTAATRRDLNDFVKSLGPTHPEDVALAIHQRALAMAPKQETPLESLPEMTDDRIFEWAEGYVFTLKGMPHKMTFSRPRFVEAVRTIIAHLPTPVAAPASANSSPELPCAECRTDMHIDGKGQAAYSADQMRAYGQACHALGRGAAVREYVENGTFKQPAAAAGPDAALIELIQKHWSGAYFHGVTKAEAREINEVLALSGAKGN